MVPGNKRANGSLDLELEGIGCSQRDCLWTGAITLFGINREQRRRVVYRNRALSSRGPSSHRQFDEYTKQWPEFGPVS